MKLLNGTTWSSSYWYFQSAIFIYSNKFPNNFLNFFEPENLKRNFHSDMQIIRVDDFRWIFYHFIRRSICLKDKHGRETNQPSWRRFGFWFLRMGELKAKVISAVICLMPFFILQTKKRWIKKKPLKSSRRIIRFKYIKTFIDRNLRHIETTYGSKLFYDHNSFQFFYVVVC